MQGIILLLINGAMVPRCKHYLLLIREIILWWLLIPMAASTATVFIMAYWIFRILIWEATPLSARAFSTCSMPVHFILICGRMHRPISHSLQQHPVFILYSLPIFQVVQTLILLL